ncbi:MAG TPA: Xaa-Pro peptidase family protein [Solirubrobacterales bacterium]
MSVERADRLAKLVSEEGLERLLVTNLVNVRYLTGFTGSNGACICGPGDRAFLTDFRYIERAASEIGGWELVAVSVAWTTGLAERLSGRCGFEDQHVSVRELRELTEHAPEGAELIPAGGLPEQLRRVKDPDERNAIAEAAKLADGVYEWTLEQGLAGRTEIEVAHAAVARMRELGAEPSFPPIVAAGSNGAMPHAEAGEREIKAGDMVVFDMGAQLDGYCSDCTRTFAVGKPSGAAQEVYELVLEAQIKALDAVAAGKTGKEVDAVAREVIANAGHGDHFGHGLGHGVGLEVHEAPRLSQRSEDTLETGEVVTVEPGIYVPAQLGVRIEDLVVVTSKGHENLSGLPKELRTVE